MTPLPHESAPNPAGSTDISPQAWQTVQDLEWFQPREGAETIPIALHWEFGDSTVILQTYGTGANLAHSIVHIDHEANQATGIPRADIYTFWPGRPNERMWFLQRDTELPAQSLTSPSQPSSDDVRKLEGILEALQNYKTQFDVLEDPGAEFRAAVGAMYDNYYRLLDMYFEGLRTLGQNVLAFYTGQVNAFMSLARKPS